LHFHYLIDIYWSSLLQPPWHLFDYCSVFFSGRSTRRTLHTYSAHLLLYLTEEAGLLLRGYSTTGEDRLVKWKGRV